MNIPDDLSELMACPGCDALYRAQMPVTGERAICARCHTVLAAPRRKAGKAIIALALSIVILAGVAAFLPFLSIGAAGLSNNVSIIDSVFVFAGGRLEVLALAMAAFVLVIPVVRAVLIVYVLLPVVFDRPPAEHAKRVFRFAEALKPWSMAEIFAIGCATALVKLTDLATVGLGPAFWMFAVVVLIIVLQERFMCSWSVWQSLEEQTT